MVVPDDLRYSEDHQWVRVEGDMVRVGITDFAQEALGEITMVQLAELGCTVAAGEELGEVEAFKAMSDLYMPIAGTVVDHNAALAATPDFVNTDPYGDGWLCIVQPESAHDVESLLDADGYRSLIGVPST